MGPPPDQGDEFAGQAVHCVFQVLPFWLVEKKPEPQKLHVKAGGVMLWKGTEHDTLQLDTEVAPVDSVDSPRAHAIGAAVPPGQTLPTGQVGQKPLRRKVPALQLVAVPGEKVHPVPVTSATAPPRQTV